MNDTMTMPTVPNSATGSLPVPTNAPGGSPGRYTFEGLRVRLGAGGELVAVRTCRRWAGQITRIKQGRKVIFTEAAVAEFERKHTVVARV